MRLAPLTRSGSALAPREQILMAEHDHSTGTGSTAAIRQHPLHPVLVPFPIAFLVGALAADMAFLSTGDVFWARAAFWLIAAGLATGVAAAALGAIDLLTLAHARAASMAWTHGALNIVVLFAAMLNLLSRTDSVVANIDWTGAALSLFTVVLLSITGWLGGEMTFKHGIGVSKAVGGKGQTDHGRHEHSH